MTLNEKVVLACENKALSMILDAYYKQEPLYKDWLDPDSAAKDLRMTLGHGWMRGYTKWQVDDLFKKGLIKVTPHHIKRINPSKGYFPQNMTVTLPLSDLVAQNNALQSTHSNKKNNKPLKAKKSKMPSFLFEEDSNGKKKLLKGSKKSDYTMARHKGFNFITYTKGSKTLTEDDFIIPQESDLPLKAKTYLKKYYTATEIRPEGAFYTLREICNMEGYPFYKVSSILEHEDDYSVEKVHEAGKEAHMQLAKGWLDHYKKEVTAESLSEAYEYFMSLLDFLKEEFPKVTKREILEFLIKGDLEDETPGAYPRMDEEYNAYGEVMAKLALRGGRRKSCYLWDPRTGKSTKFDSAQELANIMTMTTSNVKNLIKEDRPSRQGYRVTDTPNPPEELKEVMAMREIKLRALNLDGPFMKAGLSNMQRDILEHCIGLGYSLEETSDMLNLELTMMKTLINEAFNTRDELERTVAGRVGLPQRTEKVDRYSGRMSRRQSSERSKRRGTGKSETLFSD